MQQNWKSLKQFSWLSFCEIQIHWTGRESCKNKESHQASGLENSIIDHKQEDLPKNSDEKIDISVLEDKAEDVQTRIGWLIANCSRKCK